MTRLQLFLGSLLGCLGVHGVLAPLLFTAETRFVKYPLAAAQYLAGTLPAERLADLSPAYFYLHLLSQWLGGGEAALPVLLLQLLLTALTAALLGLILRDYLPPAWTVVGVALFVVSRGVIVYTGIFEPEVLLLFLLVAMVWLLGHAGRRWRLAAGGVLALALLTRPSVMPLLALVPLALYLRPGRPDWLRGSLLFLVLPLLALGLLAARNARVFDSFSPTVMNPGFVFFEGNNPLSVGQSSVYPPLVGELKNEIIATPDNPHVTYREVARRDSGQPLSIKESNDYWARRALAFMMAYPAEVLARLGHKLFSLPHNFRWHDLGPAQQIDAKLATYRLPALTLAPLFALALLGLWAVRRRWREFLLPAILVGMQVLVVMLLYVSERQRLVLLPFLILFACMGLQWVVSQAHRRKILLAGLLLAWTVLFSWPTGQMRDTLHLWEHYQQSDRLWIEAVTLRDQGRLAEAAETAAASLAAAPWLRDYSRPAFLPVTAAEFFVRARAIRAATGETTPSARLDAALLAIHAGQLDEAEQLLRQLVTEKRVFSRVYLQSSHPQYYLARIALRRGDRTEALRRAQAALAVGPGDPFTLALLYALSGEGRYRDELRDFFGELNTAWLVGVALFEAEQPAAAVAELQRVVRLLPELRRAGWYLAASLGASGRVEEGRAVHADVLASVDPVLLEKDILALYKTSPVRDGMEQFRSGLILARFGRLEQGLALMREAAEQSGDPRLLQEYRQLAGLAQNAVR